MRQKKEVMQPKSIEEVEAHFAEYAKADARIVEINAQIDQEVTAIRKKHANELQKLIDKRDTCFNAIQVYAETNEETLFTKKKSMELTHGLIGFRTGTHKLKPAKGYTWKSIEVLVKKIMPMFLRTKVEIDKERMIADRNNKEVMECMKECGITVVQEETFYIELKKETVPAV